MKPPPSRIFAIALSDMAGFGVMAVMALLLGVTVNAFRHEPLRLFAGEQPGETENPTPAEISLASLEVLSARHAVQVIDARPASFYALGHIPGAINVPYGDLKTAPETPPAALPASKLAPLVVYCSDVSCPAAKSTARILQALGYRHVTVFSGGWYFWQRAGLPVETASP